MNQSSFLSSIHSIIKHPNLLYSFLTQFQANAAQNNTNNTTNNTNNNNNSKINNNNTINNNNNEINNINNNNNVRNNSFQLSSIGMNHSNNLINQITETKIQKVNRKRSFQPSSVSTSSNNTATNNDLVNNNRSSSAIKKLHIDPSLSTNNEIDLNFIQFNIRDVNGNLPSFMTDKSVDADGKPTQSYIGLISISILSSDEKRLVLADIYKWIEDNYEYFRTRGPGWRNSIRHNLSLNDCFIKAGRAANGKGHYWAIHPANIQDFCRGDFRRRRAQRRVRKLMGYSLHDPTESDDDITQQQQSLQRQQQQNIHKINNTENTSPITLNNNNSETLKHFLQLLQKSKMKEKSIKKTNTKFFIQNLVEISDTIDLPEEDDSLCTSDISQSTPSTNSSYRFCNDDSDCSSGIVES